ncbi:MULTISPECIES: transglycosylase SLT domain-containing protein [Vibrio]|uniref:transglycosylase SLT domain-containing protein n=1 Tax=Vibrio TaxID=662 RepID=UPI002074C7EC|nr:MULTISPECIES: transglycosylase SLT domain-containing protein [Vibrio]USD35517.1 transglycosylase SLT domain-containing protein [Vibrio sp. SCSIO 43186]USD72641.1 transglycosylase SLT domain-containing protein [Vibrio sp. SCSIO 43139]
MFTDIPIDHDVSQQQIAYYQQIAASESKREPIARCILRASRILNVHPNYLYTISIAEGGRTGKYRQNADKTHDIGVMQINYETWAVELPRIGYSITPQYWAKVLKNTCTNVLVGGVIFKHRAKPAQDSLTAMANYHWYSMAENKAPHIRYKKRLVKIYDDLIKDQTDFINNGAEVNVRLRCKYAYCD